MRFCQFIKNGEVCLGAQLGSGNIVDVSSVSTDLKSLINDCSKMAKIKQFIDGKSGVPLDQLTLAPVIHNPEKVICVGLNYVDHCEEQDLPIPKEPVIFNKFPSTLIGAGDAIQIPKIGCDVDLEVELAIIIGKRGKHISKDDAMSHVFGYTIANDVSGRDWQMKRNGGQWLLGKTFDTFTPLGPIVDTEIDPTSLTVKSWINDDLMQSSNTKHLVFDIPFIINWISRVCTLNEGDVILTGTPGGVGMYSKPPRYLKQGDTCTIEIEGLGRLVSPVILEK